MLIIHLEEYEENYFDGENMKNKKANIDCFFASICILTGCLPKMIIDDVQLIQGVIVDRIKDQIKTTVICSLKRASSSNI